MAKMVRHGMKKQVCGEFPEFCYRAFDHEEHAEQFIYTGTFRMGCLLSYREIEDESRRDPTEGIGWTKEPDMTTVALVSRNPTETIWTKEMGYKEHHIPGGGKIFCFCTYLPDVSLDYMKKRLDRYFVKINDPRKLAEDINDYFIGKGQSFVIVGCKVVYDKGQKLDRILTVNERLDLAYKQKPESFSPECEFRIVAINSGEPCNREECKFITGESDQVDPQCRFIEVDLGKQLNYVSWVNLE